MDVVRRFAGDVCDRITSHDSQLLSDETLSNCLFWGGVGFLVLAALWLLYFAAALVAEGFNAPAALLRMWLSWFRFRVWLWGPIYRCKKQYPLPSALRAGVTPSCQHQISTQRFARGLFPLQ